MVATTATVQTSGDASGLELVHLLLRRVVRGFYTAKHSILLDIVLKHSAIRDDHLAQLMGLQSPEVKKLCGRLRQDRILTDHLRAEMKEGQTRMIQRRYYFVDNRDAVDAVKYRVHRLVWTIEEQSKNDYDSRGYVCPYCRKRYGALDVLSLISPDAQSFRCSDCQTVLADDEESLESKVSQERLAKLQKQTLPLVSILKQIDASFVPDNDFNTALSKAVAPSLEHLNPLAFAQNISGSLNNNNVTRTTTSALDVKIDFNAINGDTPEEQARKQAQAQTNALPEWHLRSTVSGEAIAGRNTPTTFAAQNKQEESKDVKLDASASDEVAAYYRALKAQEIAENEESDDEEEDEEEEDDFEDVVAASALASGPTSAAASATTTIKSKASTDPSAVSVSTTHDSVAEKATSTISGDAESEDEFEDV